jgi:hypothetical protein
MQRDNHQTQSDEVFMETTHNEHEADLLVAIAPLKL